MSAGFGQGSRCPGGAACLRNRPAALDADLRLLQVERLELGVVLECAAHEGACLLVDLVDEEVERDANGVVPDHERQRRAVLLAQLLPAPLQVLGLERLLLGAFHLPEEALEVRIRSGFGQLLLRHLSSGVDLLDLGHGHSRRGRDERATSSSERLWHERSFEERG